MNKKTKEVVVVPKVDVWPPNFLKDMKSDRTNKDVGETRHTKKTVPVRQLPKSERDL